MTALDVLLLASGPARLDDVRAQLEDAGHRVVRCHPDGAREAFPCDAVAGRGCPLDGAGVDVALDVRSTAWPEPTAWEAGASCARRVGVPLVVAGDTATQPFGEHAEVVLDGRYALGAAVKLAADRARAAREASVEAVCGAPVTLTRDGDRVHVVVHASPEGASARTMLATRAGGAARAVSRGASRLTVSFSAPAAG